MHFDGKTLLVSYLYIGCKNHIHADEQILHLFIHVCLFVCIADFSWIWLQIFRASALCTGTGESKLSSSVGIFWFLGKISI